MKPLGKLFWGVVALTAVIAAYSEFGRSHDAFRTEPQPRVSAGDLGDHSPRCVDGREEPVVFKPMQHKMFVERSMDGLTAESGGTTIFYDYDELSKAPVEFRNFVLTAACARNAHAEPRQADCTAIKRLRAESSVSKKKVTVIAERLGAWPGSEDKDDRIQNLYSCFEAND